MDFIELAAKLDAHEERSQSRYEELCRQVAQVARAEAHEAAWPKEKSMEGLNSDKVNIHLGDGGGRGDGGNMAAVIAALGNRNQGDNTAALIAALGNRNDGHRGDDGFGFGGGGGILGLVALLGLLRGRGLGGDDDHGGGDGCARTALTQTIVEAVGDIRAQVPQVALETQNAIQQSLAALALGTQQGFSNTKDAVQNAGVVNLVATKDVGTSVQTNALQTILAIGNDGDKTRALITGFNNENLQRQLTVAQLEGLEHRVGRHTDGVEVRVNQNVNQQQQQWQQQRFDDERFSRLFGIVANIGNQANRANQDIVNLGTMAASGTQATQATNVR